MIELAIVDDDFTIVGDRTGYVRWDEITKISAHKVDLHVYDQVCVGIHTFKPANCIELQEDWDGYNLVVAALEQHFSIADGWWPKAAFSAFRENYTVLYAR